MENYILNRVLKWKWCFDFIMDLYKDVKMPSLNFILIYCENVRAPGSRVDTA